MADLLELTPWETEDRLRVVVETPKGSSCKIRHDATTRTFTFQRPLPAQLVYPYDWGFVPGTLAEDGDPLDALVIHDSGTWPGVVIVSRPIALLKLAERKQPSDRERANHRVIAVPAADASAPCALSEPQKRDLERFFLIVGGQFKHVELRGWGEAAEARDEIRRVTERWTVKQRATD